jgi:hypothetical protein
MNLKNYFGDDLSLILLTDKVKVKSRFIVQNLIVIFLDKNSK